MDALGLLLFIFLMFVLIGGLGYFVYITFKKD